MQFASEDLFCLLLIIFFILFFKERKKVKKKKTGQKILLTACLPRQRGPPPADRRVAYATKLPARAKPGLDTTIREDSIPPSSRTRAKTEKKIARTHGLAAGRAPRAAARAGANCEAAARKQPTQGRPAVRSRRRHPSRTAAQAEPLTPGPPPAGENPPRWVAVARSCHPPAARSNSRGHTRT